MCKYQTRLRIFESLWWHDDVSSETNNKSDRGVFQPTGLRHRLGSAPRLKDKDAGPNRQGRCEPGLGQRDGVRSATTPGHWPGAGALSALGRQDRAKNRVLLLRRYPAKHRTDL